MSRSIRLLIITAMLSVTIAGKSISATNQADPWKLSKHFSVREFACKCCGETKINIQLLIALEDLRQLAGAPVIINSGYRCPLHNREVGGVKNSQHLYGNAADIRIPGYTPEAVARMAKQCGFTWTKTYSTFTHVDVRERRD